MFIALDKQGNRVHADDAVKTDVYFCQKCSKEVKPKQGKERKWHFAHVIDEGCDYGKEHDHKGKWHMRMQEYFPKESREYRFKDNETGEIHIADVYIEESNTVLEFQHSRIEENEFLSRTWFHLTNGRRIVWLFNEYYDKNDIVKSKIRYICNKGSKSKNKEWYKWLRKPRKFLYKGPDIKEYKENYSICIYSSEGGDAFRRILNRLYEFDEIALTDNKIVMYKNMETNVFFDDEGYWIDNDKKELSTIDLQNYHYEKEKEIKYLKAYLKEKHSLDLGQTLYYINTINNSVEQCILADYDFTEEKITVIGVGYKNNKYKIPIKYIGTTIFKTEVAAALYGRKE